MKRQAHMQLAVRQRCQKQHMGTPSKIRRINNPLQRGITNFLASKFPHVILETGDIPKKYTRYGSMLLLGPTFLSHSPLWTEFFESLLDTDRTDFFHYVIQAFKDNTLTHIAINAPISATKPGPVQEENNRLRSPTGLQPMYGDFGPAIEECDEQHPQQRDLEAAYWTRTIQLNGVIQVWAPRWTMFSRGNMSEKARILQDGPARSPFPGLDEAELGQELDQVDVIDFYVGIGYFAFCYLKRGVSRVWGWEINGWSVEGLRRGCSENGWGVRIVQVDEFGKTRDGQSTETVVRDILSLESTAEAIRCVVFWGDNKWARKYLNEVRSAMQSAGRPNRPNVRHCNLGLLPTSRNSWEGAVQVLDSCYGGWLHIHENVEISSVAMKAQEIAQEIQVVAQQNGKRDWQAVCCNVEKVKTYAPDVIHCVYDVKLCPPT